jgi:PAS domain S-box-containing protein
MAWIRAGAAGAGARHVVSACAAAVVLVAMAGVVAAAAGIGGLMPGNCVHWWMSPAGAVGLMMLGAGLFLAPGSRGMAGFHVLVMGGGLIGWLGVSHYLYGGEVLRFFGPMSLPTAVALLVLSAGLLCVRTDGGLIGEMQSGDAGGTLARRLLPCVVLAPALLGWLRLQGQIAGLYGTEFGLALFVLANVCVFVALVWVTAVQLNRSDRDRRMADEHRAVLAAIVASSGDAIISKTLDGVITSWNRGAEKLFGYPAAEAIGQPMLMLFPPERISEETDIIARIGKGEIIEHFETVRVARGGRRVEVSVTISPIRDTSGAVTGASKIARDISARIRSERLLSQQALLLARTQRVARLGSLEIDHACTPWQRTWSEEAYRLLGLDPATTEPSPEALKSVLHPDDRTVMDARLAAISRGEQPADADLRVVGSGQERILQVTSEVTVDPVTRAPLRTLNTLLDVTERRRSEAKFRHAIEASPTGMVMIDGAGVIVLVNAQIESLFGYERRELIGQAVEILVPERFRSRHPGDRQAFFAQPQLRKMGSVRELCGRARDGGEIAVEIGLNPLTTGDGPLVLASVADIRPRIRAEQERREQAALLAKSQQVAHLGSISVHFSADPAAPPVRSWSDETYRLLGLTPGSVPPSRASLLAQVHTDDRAKLDAVYADLLAGRPTGDYRFRVILPDGQERILHCISELEADPATGRTLRVFSTLQDVTERIRAEQAIFRQAGLLARSQRVAHLGCVEAVFGRDGAVTRVWSEETFRLFGMTPRAGTPTREEVLAVVHPEHRATVAAAFDEIALRRVPPTIEFTILGADGERLLYVVSDMDLDPATGQPLSVISTVQDVTEHRRAATRIRAQLGRLELLRQITYAIGQRHDLPSIIQVVVASLEDNLPIDFACCCRHEATSGSLIVTQLGKRSATAASALGLAVGGAIPIDGNGLSRCVAGTLVYEPDVVEAPFDFPRRLAGAGLRSLVAVPLTVNAQVIAVLLVAQAKPASFSSTDCEFLKQLGDLVALAVAQSQLQGALRETNDELCQSQQALMQQERLRALGQMAGGIAHDINNAIAPAMIYSEWLLEQEGGLSVPGRRQLTTIKRAIEDVAHTVARLREFYRRDEAQAPAVAVDLNEMVAQVIDLTHARWHDMPQQRGMVVRLVTELAPGLPVINAVASEIRESLINLVFNAVDAMPDGGTLTLRTALADAHIVVEVADTGIGMDDDTRRRCLEPFFTTKGERGTGLGLAMVYGIAERHGATIDITSAVGGGTTIRLTFPMPAVTPAATIATAPPTPGRRLRLLVIDDDPRLLASLGEFLGDEGHEVVLAADGRAGVEAFVAAVAAGKAPDAVITDLGMPHLDGRKVAEQVKARVPATPVILLTGWGQRLIGPDIPPHVDRVLDKPPSLHALRLALSQLAPALPPTPPPSPRSLPESP